MWVNKEIVSLINHCGGRAVGLSGRDGDLIRARTMRLNANSAEQNRPPELIDLGRVGEVTHVDPEVLETLDARGFIPVIAPVGVDIEGKALNINADFVAGAVAARLGAAKLILLTDVPGIMNTMGEIISTVHLKQIPDLETSGIISGGMIPKVRCCARALEGGVAKAHIVDGREQHAILLEMFTREGIGTEIVP